MALVTCLTPVALVWVTLLVSPVGFTTVDAVLALGFAIVPVLIYTTPVSPEFADRWATARGARFDEAGTDVLTRYLVRTRAARSLGVGLGLAVPLMAMAHHNHDPEAFASYPDAFGSTGPMWLIGLGYLVASLWAELTKPRLDGSSSAGATMLMRRRLTDHLDAYPGWALALAAGLAAVTSLVAVGYLASGDRTLAAWSLERSWLVAPAAVGLACVATALLVSRRRARSSDERSLAYDELTRTATINALAGTAVAMFASYVSGLVGVMTDLGLVPTLVELSLLSFGLVVWVGSGTSLVFRTRRLDRLRSAA